jgi:hypothetical protein
MMISTFPAIKLFKKAITKAPYHDGMACSELAHRWPRNIGVAANIPEK